MNLRFNAKFIKCGRPARVQWHRINAALTERQKKMKISRLFLPVAAVLLTAALAGPAAAQKFVPFSGSLQANEVPEPAPPPGFLVVNGSGGGIATHLGRFTITWHFTVNLADGTGSGALVLTGANGDQVFATAVGESAPTTTPGVFRIREVFTITGGTGRFSNAQGSVVTDRLTDLNTGFTSGSFHGTITSPGSAK
jgi:hypothetical protein